MFDLSTVVKNLPPEKEALFRQHKATLRRTFVQIAAEIGKGVWREVDDTALDAATLWLYQRAADTFRSVDDLKVTKNDDRRFTSPSGSPLQSIPSPSAPSLPPGTKS
jgi:hypothetical protein